MRLLFLSRYQHMFQRGAENFVEELSSRLSKNHSVDIFSGRDSDDITKVLNGRYDVVIPINGRFQVLQVSLGRLLGKYKLLITGHSGKGWDDILNIAVAKPDIFVALTNFMAAWAKNWAWGSKIVKIPNGVDLDKFSPRGKKLSLDMPKPVILSVGALVWYKHHDRIIKAVKELGYGSLLIVGEGLEKEKLEKLGGDLLGRRFKVMDSSYQKMPLVYRSCDLFTLPSWDREAFGTVYLEAMASGLPVVAPDDLSRREIIGDGGFFTNVDEPKVYAKVIDQCLKQDWGTKPRKQAEKFSWEKCAKKYEQVIKNLR